MRYAALRLNPRSPGRGQVRGRTIFSLRHPDSKPCKTTDWTIFMLLILHPDIDESSDEYRKTCEFLRALRVVKSLWIAQQGFDLGKALAEFFDVRAEVHLRFTIDDL